MLGCSDGEGDHAAGGSAGESGADADNDANGGSSGAGPAVLQVQPFYYAPPDQPVTLLQDGDTLQLWHAPQGGHVVVIAARVYGLDSEFIELKARIRNPDTRIIVSEESRTVVMEDVVGEPGWKQTDRRTCSQASHVPLCPDYGSRDIVGQEYLLEVLVTELYADFSAGSSELRVIPSCLQTDPTGLQLCTCECAADYTLGKCSVTGEGGTPPPAASCPN